MLPAELSSAPNPNTDEANKEAAARTSAPPA